LGIALPARDFAEKIMLIILTHDDITDDFRSIGATSIEARHFFPHRQRTITDAVVVLFKDTDGKLLCLKNRYGAKETEVSELLATYGTTDKQLALVTS
jgi:hypothetical protein